MLEICDFALFAVSEFWLIERESALFLNYCSELALCLLHSYLIESASENQWKSANIVNLFNLKPYNQFIYYRVYQLNYRASFTVISGIANRQKS